MDCDVNVQANKMEKYNVLESYIDVADDTDDVIELIYLIHEQKKTYTKREK